MPQTQSLGINNSTYAGELALPYIAPAILAADSIANGYITVHENVKFKAVMKKLSNAANLLVAESCDFTATANDLDLDEVLLIPTEMKVNQQLCKADFRQDWEALQTGASLMGDRIPPNFQTFLLQFLAAKVAEGVELSMWQGNFDPADGAATGGVAANFDGIWHHIADAEAAHLITPVAFANAIDSTNVLDRVDAVVNSASSAVLNDTNSKIYMSRKSLYLFQRALGGVVTQATATPGNTAVTAPAQGALLTGAIPNTYLGFEIITPAGFPNDCILFAQTGNLHFGCNLTTDQIEATVVDMTLTDASDNVRVAMRFSGGTQIGHIGDIAAGYIHTATAEEEAEERR